VTKPSGIIKLMTAKGGSGKSAQKTNENNAVLPTDLMR
jgi:hypothetical protein